MSNFVYEHPTISRLSRYVYGLASGTGSGDLSSKSSDMRYLVEKYSQDFPLHQATNGAKSIGDVVLVTGTTGGLGCYILSRLVSSANVTRVYALNRASSDGKSLYDRQKSALIDRGLDPAILEAKKTVLLECDTASTGFGLPSTVFYQVSFSSFWRIRFFGAF